MRPKSYEDFRHFVERKSQVKTESAEELLGQDGFNQITKDGDTKERVSYESQGCGPFHVLLRLFHLI